MTRFPLLAAAAIALAASGCNQEKSGKSDAPVSVKPIAPPAGQQWTDVVSQTEQGGFLMGNPDAPVKLVEFASMTCPHCREFEEQGMQPLIDTYVKTGQVSFEFRNFVRDRFDMAAALVARCGGPKRFFPLTRGLFAEQAEWVDRLSKLPQDQLAAVQNLPPSQVFVQIAQLAGFQQWAAQRGLPSAQTTQCLKDEAAVNKLVEMNSEAVETFNIPGTPSFAINGELVKDAATWDALEPAIKDALR